MKKIAISLKLWQVILIVIGVISLAVGGSVLYVGLTTGIGMKDVYPEDVSFVIPEEDDSYNTVLGQFEESEDFSLTIDSTTEGINKKKLQLSFTKNFAETANEDGYITSGAITIPQYVTIGEAFTVQVNKATNDTEGYEFLADGDTVNIGGISNIYAMTENKIVLPTGTKVAIDVPVYKIDMEVYDIDTNTLISGYEEDEQIVYDIVEGTQVKIKTTFLPTGSQYLYSDNFSANTDKRVKNVYYELIEGQDNFNIDVNGSEILFTATGAISSRATLQNYVFKYSLGETNFNAVHENDTDEQKYSSAVQYLTNTEESSVLSNINFVIVQANVTAFNVSNTNKPKTYTNKKYILSANSAEYADGALGIQVIDDSNKVLKQMIKNVGIRVTNEANEETADVKVVGGDIISVDGKNYTLINSNVMDMDYANWEISSSINDESKKYNVEVVLLLHDTEAEKTSGGVSVYYVYDAENSVYNMKMTFVEKGDSAVEWKDASDIEMVIYQGEGSSTEYSKNLRDIISVPAENTYQKVVFFATITDLSTRYDEYLNCNDVNMYTFEDIGDINLAEIPNGSLLIKKGIADNKLKLYFATVKTDAYGNPIMDGERYNIVSLSGAIKVKTIESVTGFSDSVFEIIETDSLCEYDLGEGKKEYVIAKGKDTFDLQITLNEKNAELFMAQLDRMTITAVNPITNISYGDILEQLDVPARDGGKITYKLKVKSGADIKDTSMILNFKYNNGIKVESFYARVKITDTIVVGYLTIYERKPEKLENSDLINPDDSEKVFYATQNTVGTEYVITGVGSTVANISEEISDMIDDIVIKDKYDRDITAEYKNNVIVVSDNENVVVITPDKKVSINPGASGGATINITCDTSSLTFRISTTSVEVDSLKVFGSDDEYDSTAIKNGEVTVCVSGAKNGTIQLSSLFSEIKITNGGTPVSFTAGLYFKINNITSILAEDKVDLYQEMLGVYNEEPVEITDLAELIASTKISKFIIKEHFGTDVVIPIRVGADNGINFVFNLRIEQNISLTTNLLKTYEYKQGSAAKITIDESYSEGIYTAVYASYPISIDKVLKATVNGGTLDAYTDWKGLYNKKDATLNILAGGKITFPETYSVQKETYILYSVDNNPYGIKYTINCKIYPNVKYSVSNNGELSIIDVRTSSKTPNEMLPISKYVFTEDAYKNVSGTVSYAVTTLNGISTGLKISEGSFATEQTLILSQEEGLRRSFGMKVSITSLESTEYKDIVDYTGNAINPTLYLTAGFTYDEFVAVNNAWLYGTVTNNSKEYLLAKYSSNTNQIISTESSVKFNVIYTDIILNGTGTSLFKFSSVKSMGSIDGLYNNNSYLSIIICSSGEPKEDFATVYLPIIISTVGELPYVYYENYNDGVDGYDLSTITNINKTKDADLYTDVCAGSVINVIKDIANYLPNYADIEYEETATGIYSLKKNGTTIRTNVPASKLEFYVKTKIQLTDTADETKVIPAGVVVALSAGTTEGYKVKYIEKIVVDNVNPVKLLVTNAEDFIARTKVVLDSIPVNTEVTYTINTDGTYKVTYAREIVIDNVLEDGKLARLARVVNDEGIYCTDSAVNIELSIAKNYIDKDGVALASIVDNEVVLKNYAGEEKQYVIIKAKFTSLLTTYQYFYYRLRVESNIITKAKYVNDVGCEYQMIDGSLNEGLSDKFITTTSTSSTYTYKITSINIGKTEYKNFDKGAGVYEVTDKIRITISGDNIRFETSNTKDINITLRKIYDDIVDGGTDYFFNINGSAYIYSVEYQAGKVFDNTWTINPEYSTLNITTKRTSEGSTVITSVDPSLVDTTAKFYKEDGTEFTSSELTSLGFEFINGVLKYTAPASLPIKNKIVKVRFTVTVYKDALHSEAAIYSGEIANTELTVVVNAKTKITEATTILYGGTSYNVIGNLISTVEEFDDGEFTDITSTVEITSVTCDKTYITYDSATKKISIPAMSVDTDVVFTVVINDSTFYISRTILTNVVQPNGDALEIVEADAPSYAFNEVYYAGDKKTIGLDKFIKYIGTTNENDGGFSLVENNKTVNGVEFTFEIKENKTLTIKSDNVANITPSVKVPVGIKYTKAGYEFTFYVNVIITIQPNVVASTNYPNPTGEEELTAETINSGSVIDSDFFEGKADFATAERVVFTQKSTTACGDWSYSVQSWTNVEVDEETGKVTLSGSNSTGTITYQIVCNKVIATYTLYVIKADEKIYSSKINGTINYVNGVETIYADNIDDARIFQNDRLVGVDINTNDVSNYLNKLIEITFKNDDSTDFRTVKFLVNSDYTNKTIYLEAGKSLSGYEVYRLKLDGALISDATATVAILNYWKTKISTNERINFYYTSIDGTKLIDKKYNKSDKVAGEVANESTEKEIEFNLKLETGDSRITCKYKYKFDVDIRVDLGMMSERDPLTFITINASDYLSPRDLVTLAGIKHPSTGEYISKEDFGKATSDLSIVYNKENPIYATFFSKAYGEDVLATWNKMANGAGVIFLTWTKDKGTNSEKAYNYEFKAEGAANNGSWVLLKYNYSTSSSISKDFYIMVYIKPDYAMSVNGINYTYQTDGVVDKTIISTSTNEGNAYSVKYDTSNESDKKYLLNITSKIESGIVKIIGKNLATGDYAHNWSYTMMENDSDGATTYNNESDISKFNLSGTAIGNINGTSSNGWTKTTESSVNYYKWSNGNALTIKQADANIFGTKNYRIKITNIYGYECYFYFNILPINNNDPAATASFTSISEGDTFDIGAVYDLLTLTPEAKERYNFYDNEGNLLFYSQDGKTLLSYDSSIKFSDNEVGNDTSVTIEGATQSITLSNLESNLIKRETYFTYNEKTYTAQYQANYDLTAVSTTTENGGKNVIDVSGINAWAYNTILSNLKINQINQSNSKYLQNTGSDIMMLPYVTVNSISYYYQSEEIAKTAAGLSFKMATGSSGKKALKFNDVVSGISATIADDAIYRVYKEDQITIPVLPGWIYSKSANITAGQAYPNTDTAEITIVIRLEFNKDGQREFRDVPIVTTVKRKAIVNRTGTLEEKTVEGTVSDGEEFRISDKFIVTSKMNAASETSYSVFDDTLVVTLPAMHASLAAQVKVTGKVISDGAEVATLEEITFRNTLSTPRTFYQSLSEKLVQKDKDVAYVLKENDKIVLTFSGYNNNAILKGDMKFYVRYQGKVTETSSLSYIEVSNTGTDKATITKDFIVSAITQDKINIEDSSLFFNNVQKLKYNGSDYTYTQGLSVIKSYIIYANSKYYRVEKEYFVTPACFAPGDNISGIGLDTWVNVNKDSTNGTKYTVNYATWAEQVEYMAGTGTSSTTSKMTGSNLKEKLSKLYIVIKGEDFGTATIDDEGKVTTWAGYKLGENEYISVKVYVKASGFDGSYSEKDETYDHYLGTVRLFVK